MITSPDVCDVPQSYGETGTEEEEQAAVGQISNTLLTVAFHFLHAPQRKSQVRLGKVCLICGWILDVFSFST